MWARNGRWILPENARLPRSIPESFTCRKSTTWNRRLYFPSEGRRAEDFFALKNPTASAGFEPANLGTKGQYSTSRPPKPLILTLESTPKSSNSLIFIVISLSPTTHTSLTRPIPVTYVSVGECRMMKRHWEFSSCALCSKESYKDFKKYLLVL